MVVCLKRLVVEHNNQVEKKATTGCHFTLGRCPNLNSPPTTGGLAHRYSEEPVEYHMAYTWALVIGFLSDDMVICSFNGQQVGVLLG